jgi:hypothetical protein
MSKSNALNASGLDHDHAKFVGPDDIKNAIEAGPYIAGATASENVIQESLNDEAYKNDPGHARTIDNNPRPAYKGP